MATRTSAPIAFLRGRQFVAVQLVAVDPHSGKERMLAQVRKGRSIRGFEWSPDGRRLLYMVETGSFTSGFVLDVHVAKADGSDARKIRRVNVYTQTPTWSPRGDAILIDDNDDGSHTLWVVRPDGSGAVQLLGDAFGAGNPAWSPDGTQIAYHDEVGDWIHVVSTNGGTPRRLARSASPPRWAPAKQISFVVGKNIWFINPDGSGRRRATRAEAILQVGQASPDGRAVATYSWKYFRDDADLYLRDLSGGVRKLTDNAKDDRYPTWSPDGKSLSFVRSERAWEAEGGPNPVDVYVINADGSGERNLTNSAADEWAADWSPEP